MTAAHQTALARARRNCRVARPRPPIKRPASRLGSLELRGGKQISLLEKEPRRRQIRQESAYPSITCVHTYADLVGAPPLSNPTAQPPLISRIWPRGLSSSLKTRVTTDGIAASSSLLKTSTDARRQRDDRGMEKVLKRMAVACLAGPALLESQGVK